MKRKSKSKKKKSEVVMRPQKALSYNKDRIAMLAFLTVFFQQSGRGQKEIFKAYKALFGDRLTRGRVARIYVRHGGNKEKFIDANLPRLSSFFGKDAKGFGHSTDELTAILESAARDEPEDVPTEKESELSVSTPEPPPEAMREVPATDVIHEPAAVVPEPVQPSSELVETTSSAPSTTKKKKVTPRPPVRTAAEPMSPVRVIEEEPPLRVIKLPPPKERRPSITPDQEAIIAKAIVATPDGDVYIAAAKALSADTEKGRKDMNEEDVMRFVKTTPGGLERFLVNHGCPEHIAIERGRMMRKRAAYSPPTRSS